MRDCMLAREQELCQGRGVDTSLSGTTAVFALVRKDELVSFICFVVLLCFCLLFKSFDFDYMYHQNIFLTLT